MTDARVSFDDEMLILVDESDEIVGYDNKAACHDGQGRLHRAFSVFLFDSDGRVLLQQRAAGKRLWPMYWSNSCCSHPRRGELLDAAAHRRVKEELNIDSELTYLYKFTYQATFRDAGSEHELCGVFAGRAESEAIAVNDNEVHAWKWIDADLLDGEIEAHPEIYTPWLKLEWKRLRSDHWPALLELWR